MLGAFCCGAAGAGAGAVAGLLLLLFALRAGLFGPNSRRVYYPGAGPTVE